MFKILREVEELAKTQPGSKKEDEELTKRLQSYIKENPRLIPQIYFICKELNCLKRIKEAVKSNDSPSALGPLLFQDLLDEECVEVLICCPNFLEAFIDASLGSGKNFWELWKFIFHPETDDILQRSLRQTRLNICVLLQEERRDVLLKAFFSQILESYIQKDQLHILESYEIKCYYENSKASPELLNMFQEICIIQSQHQGKLVTHENLNSAFYLALLDRSVSFGEIEHFMGMKGLEFIAAVDFLVNCPEVRNTTPPFFSEASSVKATFRNAEFITPELSLAKFILSDEFAFDPCLNFPEWSLKYCFLRVQIETLESASILCLCKFIKKHPQYFDHGFAFLSLAKGVHEFDVDELRALLYIACNDSYFAQEVCSLLEKYPNPLVITVASEYSYIPNALRLVKNHFELVTDSIQRAVVIGNLVAEEKASQSTLESCLYYILRDFKTAARKEAWPQYLRILRNMVNVRLVSPVRLWTEILKNLTIGECVLDLYRGVFSILETLYLIPLVIVEEVEEFDESVKEPIDFIVESISAMDVRTAFAFKALCTLPDQKIKRLLPTITDELLQVLLVPEAVEALAKYTFLEIQSMPRTLLLGTDEANFAKRKEHVDISWFQPKKCAYSWFTDDFKGSNIMPILSVPFTLRQVVVRKVISYYFEIYSSQKDPKLIASSNIVVSTCSGIAFSRFSGSAGKLLLEIQARIQTELENPNLSEEELAGNLLSAKLLTEEGEVFADNVLSKIQEKCSRKYLDPTVAKQFETSEISEELPEFKGYGWLHKGLSATREELVSSLKELLSQPMAIGLVNALSLAIGYSNTNQVEKDVYDFIVSRLPEIAFKQAKFSIWIDAFYFCTIDSNKTKEEKSSVLEHEYKRIGKEYVVRLLLDRRDSLCLQVLAKCEHLPRLDWSPLLTGKGSTEEELVMKHIVSRIVKDNPFVSPSLKTFAVRLFEATAVSDFLLSSLESLIEATDKRTVTKIMRTWDLEKINVPLLLDVCLRAGLEVEFVEKFIIEHQITKYFGQLAKIDCSTAPLTIFARLMCTSWALPEFERVIQRGISEEHLVLFKVTTKAEIVDVILTCAKIRGKSFAAALLQQHTPFKTTSENLLWNTLILDTSLAKRKRILSLLKISFN